MKKIISCVALVFGFIMPGLAAEIYVDASSTAETPNGSQGSPYKTIAAAVKAANSNTEEASTVFVKGHHVIDGKKDDLGEDDLVTVTAAGMTIRAWGDEKPLVEISKDLSVNLGNEDPKVFEIKVGADHCTIRNLSFKYYSQANEQLQGNSLGKGGRLFSVYGNDCVIHGCEFRRNGSRTAKFGGQAVIYNEATQHTLSHGARMDVCECVFENVGFAEKSIIRTGSDNRIINNIFKDSAGYYMYPVKVTSGGYFVSNRVVNCSSPLKTNGENWQEIPSPEIAYNIFVCSDVSFIQRNGTAGFRERPMIHNNTIVGCDNFIYVEDMSNKKWTPWIFDNLIVLKEGGVVINEAENDALGSFTTSFVTQKINKVIFTPKISGNAYFAAQFSGGSATSLQGYDLYGEGLVCENNIRLGVAPEFLNTTDITSEDFYRINSTKYPWVLDATGTDDFVGEYIGAVPPKAIDAAAGEYFLIDNFAVEYDSLFAPVSATFTVGYSQNAGEVEVSWDFNGDGEYDETGSDTSVSHTYTSPGNYLPSVRVTDKDTGKILTMQLVSGSIDVRLKNVWVDSLANDGGDGSEVNPFKTIREGVDVCGEKGTVYVNGGEGRTYEINSTEDIITVNLQDVTIKSFDGLACIRITQDLLDNDGRPVSLITVAEGANNLQIAGLEFLYDDAFLYKKLKVEGLVEKEYYGYIIDISGNKTKIDNCVFRLIGPGKSNGHTYAVKARAEESRQDLGEDITVSNCIFKDETGGVPKMKSFYCGTNPKIINNIYMNCATIFYPLKKGNCDFLFVSNRLVECSSLSFNGGQYQEIPRGVIAYNIFMTSNGTPFLGRQNYGFTSNESFIHHNTVVGSTNFIYQTGVGNSNFNTWSPQIYDNLLILSTDGIMINENGTSLKSGSYSSFKTEVNADVESPAASFYNNAYMSSDQFTTGTATLLEEYDLSRGLKVEKNTEIAEAPRFMSTDVNSPDFMRPRARKGDYPFSAAVGGYPNYVGAQEPKLRPEGMRVIIR